MDRSKGVAYCGLTCCVCGDKGCPGCRNEGCSGKDWCKNYKCCREKGFGGCWECEDFPCEGGMLEKMRIRAFAEFIKRCGEDELMDCLERNEKKGVIYHHEGQLTGDYDRFETEEEIIRFIKSGF
jgi:hypothetical protein